MNEEMKAQKCFSSFYSTCEISSFNLGLKTPTNLITTAKRICNESLKSTKVKRLPHCKASEKEINRLEYSSSIRNLPLLVCLVVCAKPLRYECNLFFAIAVAVTAAGVPSHSFFFISCITRIHNKYIAVQLSIN
ncbi:hypothetical protein GQX74_009794 [Glossina fuscipes]|nr:hypothetical protein GQX74_009794 [Glossina fuscipes]